jgi:putative transposase
VGKMSVSDQTFYLWEKHYADMIISEIHQLKEFGEENQRFKHLVAELTLDRQILQNVLSRKL